MMVVHLYVENEHRKMSSTRINVHFIHITNNELIIFKGTNFLGTAT